MQVKVIVATASHAKYAVEVCEMMAEAAKVRGTGIAKREPSYITKKMEEGKAVIALDGEKLVGFCYIESWENQKYVANSGLIVHPDYRGTSLAKEIKKTVFDLSKKLFPKAQLFGITTSPAVMKINSDLGYRPVAFAQLTQDDTFWKGCQSCKNHDILERTGRTMCLCTGMICDLSKAKEVPKEKKAAWERFKQFVAKRKTGVLKRFQKGK
ncbi:GNAT family N-acetyltransferase [Bacteroidota bacterium]